MICKINGCTVALQHKFFCARHWKQIPLKLREEFWERTDYGKNEPPPGLLERINAVVKS